MPAAASETIDIVRPPTGTPTTPPLSSESAIVVQVPTATGTPMVTPSADPPIIQRPIATIERALPATGVDCALQISDYRDLLAVDAVPSIFQAPLIAACLADSGDRAAAIELYQELLKSDLDPLTEVTSRQQLGDLLLEAGDYSAALVQYEAILGLAETQVSRGRALYQAGQAEILAGNLETGYARLLSLVTEYPEASQSYKALTELLAAGYAVDDYLQGQVAYNAQAYNASAAAFARAIEADPGVATEAHLHLARSLEKLGDVDGALARLDTFIAQREAQPSASAAKSEAAQARIERAKINERAGRPAAALDGYQAYLGIYPQGADAPLAAWRSASLSEALGDRAVARDGYLAFAQSYPDHNDAAQAWFRAGFLSWELDENEEAHATWRLGAGAYPERDYGAASLLWLLKTLPTAERADYEARALNGSGLGYYAPRAGHLVNGVEPFATSGSPNFNLGDTGQAFAESWLRELLGLSPDASVAEPSGDLSADPRLERAEFLWSIGATAEAARLFENLRTDYSGDALASYQLALYFRDLGLYKSSILAALAVMDLAGVGAAGAPRFIARLAYPAHYADLIAAEAQRYGYDPLLQLALIWEESYFDAMATSPLGALGLSQILPETGSYIAGQLGWPSYDAGALYRPETAVPFGAYFLDQQLDRYDGNVAAALAAYNAGPGFADAWAQQETDDYDRLLEIIDFPESQRYIKQIYITHSIYRFLYS